MPENTSTPYSADRSLYSKLRRRVARLMTTRPADLTRIVHPLLTISFDDAPTSAADQGASILKKHGVKGTYFISAGLTGHNSHLGAYTRVDEIKALASAGHEIACHTYSHLDCGKAHRADIVRDLNQNQESLKRMGLAGSRTFAYPYGDVSPAAKAIMDERYIASRALHHGLITTGTDLNQTPAVGIEGPCGEQIANEYMVRARAVPSSWLVLYTHDVREHPSQWGCTPQALDRLIGNAIRMGFEIVTFEAGARRVAGASRPDFQIAAA